MMMKNLVVIRKIMYKKKFRKKKKKLYSKEYSEDEEISEDEENKFMKTVNSEDDSDVEGEVDLKAELITSLEKLRKRRIKNKYLNMQLSKYQEEVEVLKQVVLN